MSREDICNVEPLDVEDVLAVLSSMQALDLIDFYELESAFGDDDRIALTEGGAS